MPMSSATHITWKAGKKYANAPAAPVSAERIVPVSTMIQTTMKPAIALRLNRATDAHVTTLERSGVSPAYG